jgi:hypothetical protein
VLGWLYTDGRIQWSSKPDGPSRSHGRKHGVFAAIYQAKPWEVVNLDALLADIPHRKRIHEQGQPPAYVWCLNPSWFRDLWSRAGLDRISLSDLVLRMDGRQRKAFLDACCHAEGCLTDRDVWMVSQNEGPVRDAIALTGYLEGHYVRHSLNRNVRSRTDNYVMRMSKPRVTMQRVTKTDAGSASVWCVATGLGTWTMRQGHKIMVTGNTLYGGGANAHHLQAGTTIEESAEIILDWHGLYQGVKPYSKWIGKFDPIVTGSGRRIPADPGRPYASINFDIQSVCRDLLVGALYKLFCREPWMAPMLWLLVHDEAILMCRRSQAPRVAQLLTEAMNFDYRGVQITATAEILGTHWGTDDVEQEAVAA